MKLKKKIQDWSVYNRLHVQDGQGKHDMHSEFLCRNFLESKRFGYLESSLEWWSLLIAVVKLQIM